MPIRGTIIMKFKIHRRLRGSKRAFDRAHKEVAEEMEFEIKRKVARAYPPASKHGQFPRLRSGKFRTGIKVTGTAFGITVSSVQKYGKYLEDGTVNMRPRTWAKRVLVWGDNRAKWEKKIGALARIYTGRSAISQDLREIIRSL